MTEPLLSRAGPRRQLRPVAGAVRGLDRRGARIGPGRAGRRTAPARAPSPGPSPVWCRRPPAGSPSTGRTSPGCRPTASAGCGLTYIPEGRGIFPRLSVTDNLRMAVAQEPRGERSAAIERAIEQFPVLGKRPSQRAGSLSGGEQQMLALARAFAVSPKLIIADELSLGLAPLGHRVGLREPRRGPELRDHHRAERAVRPPGAHDGRQLRDPHPGRVGWAGPASEAGQEVLDRYLGEAEPGAGRRVRRSGGVARGSSGRTRHDPTARLSVPAAPIICPCAVIRSS